MQYLSSVAHFRKEEPDQAYTITWSDVNIIVELYGFQDRFDEGILQLKSLARWLLGRGQEKYWEAFDKDDREWDSGDAPRRIEVPDFVPGRYDSDSYGEGLPLDLRIKLGIFRLKGTRQDLEEAIVRRGDVLHEMMLADPYRTILNGLNRKMAKLEQCCTITPTFSEKQPVCYAA